LRYFGKKDPKSLEATRRNVMPSKTRFVIHEHHASHLHYDLRLEIGGVLKSLAVPKGPSMNPADKRLAILVGDHPLVYFDFEGILPGEIYGTGPVVIWDEGDFEPLEDPEAALGKGRLSFRLAGKRLCGEFALALMKGRGTGKEWLLMKKKDGDADPAWKLEQALTLEKRKTLKERVPPCHTS
jgi:bifunctional non-homologous end joining protein LigD